MLTLPNPVTLKKGLIFLTKRLTTSAILIALSAVLSVITVLKMPYEGSVTAASMVPVLAIGFIWGTRQGIVSAFAYALLQMLLGFSAPPVQTVWYFLAVVMLDYIIAFGVLGLSDIFYKMFGKFKYKIALSGGICVILRFLCHFLSGILIWSTYAPEGQSPALYSLIYNGSYMGVELVITVLVLLLLAPVIEKQRKLK